MWITGQEKKAKLIYKHFGTLNPLYLKFQVHWSENKFPLHPGGIFFCFLEQKKIICRGDFFFWILIPYRFLRRHALWIQITVQEWKGKRKNCSRTLVEVVKICMHTTSLIQDRLRWFIEMSIPWDIFKWSAKQSVFLSW